MSVRQKTIEVRVCDFCENPDSECYMACLGCGMDVCHDCQSDPSVGTCYRGSTSTLGAGDGFYCLDCRRRETSDLFLAYADVARAAEVYKTAIQAARRMCDEANARLKSLLDEKETV